jgi:hypothetical protein
VLLSRHQNAGQNHDIKLANRSFENVSQFKYLQPTVTNQKLIQEGIKRRLNSSSAFYHSFQNLLPSRPLSKKVKIRIYKSIFLPVILCCENCSLTLREVYRPRVFEDRVPGKTFGLKSYKVMEGSRKLHTQ